MNSDNQLVHPYLIGNHVPSLSLLHWLGWPHVSTGTIKYWKTCWRSLHCFQPWWWSTLDLYGYWTVCECRRIPQICWGHSKKHTSSDLYCHRSNLEESRWYAFFNAYWPKARSDRIGKDCIFSVASEIDTLHWGTIPPFGLCIRSAWLSSLWMEE